MSLNRKYHLDIKSDMVQIKERIIQNHFHFFQRIRQGPFCNPAWYLRLLDKIVQICAILIYLNIFHYLNFHDYSCNFENVLELIDFV